MVVVLGGVLVGALVLVDSGKPVVVGSGRWVATTKVLVAGGAWVVGGIMLGVIATLVTLGICRWFGIIA